MQPTSKRSVCFIAPLLLILSGVGCDEESAFDDASSDADEVRKPRCGNGVCNQIETCSSCPADCGVCSVPDAASSDAASKNDASVTDAVADTGSPATRPFSAPVTTATYNVPTSIDKTGATDVAAALNTFISSVPNGSVVAFPAGATFKITKGLLLSARSNIVLQGNGATLQINGSGSDEALSAFLLRGSSHVAIDGFKVVGPTQPLTTNLGENAHVLGLSGWYGGAPSSYVEMANVNASNIFGDGIFLEGRNVAPYEPSHHVWVHDSSFDYLGRNGISLIDVTDVLVEHNTFDHVSYHVVDFEPNLAQQVVSNMTFRRNTVGSYAHRQNLIGYFVSDIAIDQGVGSLVSGTRIEENTVAGIAAGGYDGKPRALNSKFISTGGVRHKDLRFTGNTTTRTVAGPAVLYFKDIDGVVATGNVQPLSSSTFAQFDNCTNVVGP